MALYYAFPVFHDVYHLILLLFRNTKEFSREYKYSLSLDIKRDGILVRSIYRANKSRDKRQYL